MSTRPGVHRKLASAQFSDPVVSPAIISEVLSQLIVDEDAPVAGETLASMALGSVYIAAADLPLRKVPHILVVGEVVSEAVVALVIAGTDAKFVLKNGDEYTLMSDPNSDGSTATYSTGSLTPVGSAPADANHFWLNSSDRVLQYTSA